ncbi:hypothetical protein MBSD_n1974 [Mizugakiibacter sediminis]|uniref:DUF2784 domain-containing protein n=1 Tax=Mizugakiibacter sediminis TaxID=1475481 RepID=A0A0K8QP61_9GAMM|nr:DUF2784 domain-containing protein [Mizugakiibacter sediminis]GAP66663.1 hypothetical protein MBSD_n1974 [Mizugakiibacter sediminis]
MSAVLPPALASALADALLVAHAGVVAFVVLGEAAFLLGGRRGWRWVRGLRLRLAHLALTGFIAAQTWLGELCPLTLWEQALRARAGEATYRGSFIGHWLDRLLYIDAPWWAFVVAYTAFLALVALTWRLVPPQLAPRGRR